MLRPKYNNVRPEPGQYKPPARWGYPMSAKSVRWLWRLAGIAAAMVFPFVGFYFKYSDRYLFSSVAFIILPIVLFSPKKGTIGACALTLFWLLSICTVTLVFSEDFQELSEIKKKVSVGMSEIEVESHVGYPLLTLANPNDAFTLDNGWSVPSPWRYRSWKSTSGPVNIYPIDSRLGDRRLVVCYDKGDVAGFYVSGS